MMSRSRSQCEVQRDELGGIIELKGHVDDHNCDHQYDNNDQRLNYGDHYVDQTVRYTMILKIHSLN